jgi:His-Xaa-Ser system radical SAM maturase HxsC
MITLSSSKIECHNFSPNDGWAVLRLTEQRQRPRPLQCKEAFLVRDQNPPPDGFRLYIASRAIPLTSEFLATTPVAILPEEFDYLADGDIIRLDPARQAIRVLYRRNSSHNNFLVTERCNHYCLMCSQPPRNIDDSWIADEIAATIPLIDPTTVEIGFTGGEPTLLGGQFLHLLRLTKSYLPHTAIHVLSNGRRFADLDFAAAYASIQHPDLMVGIPLYSDISSIHDYVVQADGAYDETIRGILNLKRSGQKVEIRVVIHAQTYSRLPQLATFIARNLTFVDHVALMGLEMTGFTKANLDKLWIDPLDYQTELYKAAVTLAEMGMTVSIYNHQLCVLDRRLWPFATKSISDWKREYMPECDGCTEQSRCGGFFASAKLRYSKYIKPLHGEASRLPPTSTSNATLAVSS